MDMDVSVQYLLDSLPVLEQMTQMPVKDMDPGVVFHVGRVYRQVKPECEVADLRVRNLIAALGTEKTPTGQERLKPNLHKEFIAQRAELLEATVPMNNIEPFTMEELEVFDLNIGQLSALMWLLKEEKHVV
jgi:hypothetical protein